MNRYPQFSKQVLREMRQILNGESKPSDIRYLFEPRSVAVVGASDIKTKYGYFLMKNLIDLGYKGRIYPVNKKRDEVFGLRCFPTVDSIPDEVETAILIVPATNVLQVIKDCARKGVKGVIVCTSGFREVDEKGLEIEKSLVNVAKKAGIRIVGPNTSGILNTANGFTSAFVSVSMPKKGPVSFIAQTGMFASVLLEYVVSSRPFGLSKIAGLGNKCDVDDADVLEYLHQNDETKVIAIYMEGIRNGRRFFKVAKKIVKEKPVMVLKSAYSNSGGDASLTHTGSLLVKDEIFNAVCKSSGLIRVEDLEEMFDLIKAFALLPLPKGDRIGVIAYTGAGCVMSADACEKYELKIAELSNETMKELIAHAPSFAKIRNPIDAELLRQGMADMDSSLKLTLETIMKDENVDAVSVVLVGLSKGKTMWEIDIDRVFSSVRKKFPEKPIVATMISGRELIEECRIKLERLGIPFYPSLLRNIRALAGLYNYEKLLHS